MFDGMKFLFTYNQRFSENRLVQSVHMNREEEFLLERNPKAHQLVGPGEMLAPELENLQHALS